MNVLDKLHSIFSDDATEIRNRASAVSIYLLVEDMIVKGTLDKEKEKKLRKFYIQFLKSLKREVSLGIDATNRFLVNYQNRIIQAADSKVAIQERHEKLNQALDYFLKNDKII